MSRCRLFLPDLPYTNCSNLSAANIKIPIIDKIDPIALLYFFSSKIASTKPRNNGCALFGRDLSSGCACVPMKNG